MKITIPRDLQNEIRKLPLDARFKGSLALAQYGADIWFTDKEVERHTDNSDAGKDSIFCVLVNDSDFKFRSFAEPQDSPDGLTVPLSVGTVIRHNGRNSHEVFKTDKRRKGRFAVLIWDVPKEKETSVLAKEIMRELHKPIKRALVETVFS